VQRLYTLLVRAARFQLRRVAARAQLRGESFEDVATEAADDALVAILARLDDFRGASRFETWASKFAVFEVSSALRRRVWKGRELPLELSPPELLAASPEEIVERLEWLDALRVAIAELLTERQRYVFVAVALNQVPIDVVAERLSSTRGAVYKTLHDARRRLRASDFSDTRRDRSSAASSARA
jgi:RNA polymerase sigma-70 factor, ECF subfamily